MTMAPPAVLGLRRALWCAVFGLFYLWFLATCAPASLLGWALADSTNRTVTLESPGEGFWHGHARRVRIVDSRGRASSYEQLRWEWLGTRLVMGELAFRIHVADPKLRGTAQIAWKADGEG